MIKAALTLIVAAWVMFLGQTSLSYAREIPFTQEDRDRLIRVEAKLEDIDKRFEQIDKRFEQIDKRFEQIDNRFDDLKTFLWIISGIFTTIMAANIGFAYWDRRTIIKKAKEDTIAEIEKEGRLRDMISALRELSKTDAEVAKVLKQFNLL